MRERICLGGCSDVTEDDLKEFKVLEFIEVEPDKLVWNDAGTGTWMSGPPVFPFDTNFSGPWFEHFRTALAGSTHPWYRSRSRGLILDPDRPNT